MLRYTLVACLQTVLLGGLLPAVHASSRDDLERRLLDYLNGRMYGCCQAVVLTGGTNSVYEGYVQFHNGRRNDLRVTASGHEITYALVESHPAVPEAKVPTTEQPQRPKTTLEELQAVIARQEREIARLQGLRIQMEGNQEAVEPNREPSVAVAASESGAASGAAASDAPAAPDAPAPLVTRGTYEKIEKGMSPEHVAAILGTSGLLLSSSRFDDALNEIYVWTNPDDSHVCVVFQDDRVLIATHFGLDHPVR